MSGIGTRDGGLQLEALRERLAASPDAARLRPLGLGRIVAGPQALAQLRPILTDLIGERTGPVALLVDATRMWRRGVNLKPCIVAALEPERQVRPVRVGPPDGPAHADEETVAAALAAVRGCMAIVSVGSGTVADIGKVVSSELGGLPHVVVQTAASVNGFADDQSVLLRNGVKRTVQSRWPDVLLLDGATLADAPAALSLAGLGDLVSMFTAGADWYLARAVGLDDSYSETVVALGREHGDELLALAPRLARGTSVSVGRLAEILAVSGISMGVAGRTAPSSGMEHTVSHLLEMAAERRGAGGTLHGAKVGVTTIVAALTWRQLRRRIAERGLELRFPSAAEMEPRVRAAFEPLDPSGAMAEECWRDYRVKLERWRANREALGALAGDWDAHEVALDGLLVEPATLVGAMREAGAPVRFSELDPAVDAATARWAIANCHLMRDRFTVADLACFTGAWEEADVEQVLADAAELGAGL
ncbi:MAG TPA: iron-containing alcohol dehydrogenase [Solirubrobacterales bacterium]|jgi:glycerol-1-phosphate dehydrogenase [NAD(P)+]|nr:iron-containing alcohol dehydrogenase [Solirubrobacterales bacterium]